MDSSVLENQMDSSIQRGKEQLQQQYNATASAYTTKVDGVLHDITMPSGALLLGNIGKGAVAIARNTGLIDAPEGGYVDTMINKGVSGVIKRGVKETISKSSDAVGSGESAIPETTDITVQNPLFEDSDTFADASSNLASSQSGVSLIGQEGTTQGARLATATETGAETATETGADAATDALATATETSTLFDDVPVAGLVVTGLLAVGTEIASWFESTPSQKVNPIGVQASQTTGLNTI